MDPILFSFPSMIYVAEENTLPLTDILSVMLVGLFLLFW